MHEARIDLPYSLIVIAADITLHIDTIKSSFKQYVIELPINNLMCSKKEQLDSSQLINLELLLPYSLPCNHLFPHHLCFLYLKATQFVPPNT